jgi:outer membrane protein OmpA-like peptidoglycan-associated protein
VLNRNTTIAAAAFGCIVLGALGYLTWSLSNRVSHLDVELGATREQAEAEQREKLRYAEQLELERKRAGLASERAAQAEESVIEAAERLERLETEKSGIEQEAGRLRGEADEARREAELTREELNEVSRRRIAELDRMQQALNRIAETKRTPAGMVTVLSDESFRFGFDSASLDAGNRELLSRIAGILMASEGYRLFIYGHTDDVGTADYNQDLSERRARAVRDYLVKAGVPESIVDAEGFGKTNPRAKGSSETARAKNRRVEIGVVDTIVNYDLQAAER